MNVFLGKIGFCQSESEAGSRLASHCLKASFVYIVLLGETVHQDYVDEDDGYEDVDRSLLRPPEIVCEDAHAIGGNKPDREQDPHVHEVGPPVFFQIVHNICCFSWNVVIVLYLNLANYIDTYIIIDKKFSLSFLNGYKKTINWNLKRLLRSGVPTASVPLLLWYSAESLRL